MHGIGNDYIYINCFEETLENPNELSIKLSNRNFGIGGDGIVLIMPSEISDFRMRMFNSDGSESEMCGNAIRCVGKYVYDKGLTNNINLTIETKAGIREVTLLIDNDKVTKVKVNMGEPILEAYNIPVNIDVKNIINQKVNILNEDYYITCVSMGNPHAITFVKDVSSIDLLKIGPEFEHNELFPQRINTEFVEVIDNRTLKMRVWERGSGETKACGTGACAVLVASVLNNISQREVTVKLLGGELIINWDKETNNVFMTGSAAAVFDGELID